MKLPTANIKWTVCDDGHVHLHFVDENGDVVFAITIDIENWCDLADEIDEEIEVMIAVQESEEAVKH